MYVYVARSEMSYVRRCRTIGIIGCVPNQFCELRPQFCDHVEVPNLCSEFGVMRGRSQSCELGGSDPVLLPEIGFVTVLSIAFKVTSFCEPEHPSFLPSGLWYSASALALAVKRHPISNSLIQYR